MRFILISLGIIGCATLLCFAGCSGYAGLKQQKTYPLQVEGGPPPDFTEANETCLVCHSAILEVSTGRDDVPQLHKRHLESKQMAYRGLQRRCTTCHESWTTAKEEEKKHGYFEMGGVFHPLTAHEPKEVWNKLIQRPNTHGNPVLLEAVRPEEPYTFKPSLKRLVCLDCHGPDSKIKVLYGTSEKSGK
jgi:hypothetical protein